MACLWTTTTSFSSSRPSTNRRSVVSVHPFCFNMGRPWPGLTDLACTVPEHTFRRELHARQGATGGPRHQSTQLFDDPACVCRTLMIRGALRPEASFDPSDRLAGKDDGQTASRAFSVDRPDGLVLAHILLLWTPRTLARWEQSLGTCQDQHADMEAGGAPGLVATGRGK